MNVGRAVASAVALFVAQLLHLFVYGIWTDFSKPGLGSEVPTSIVSKHLVYYERNLLTQHKLCIASYFV